MRAADPKPTPRRPLVRPRYVHPNGHDTSLCGPSSLAPALGGWFWDNEVLWHGDGAKIFFSGGPVVYEAATDGSRVEAVANAFTRPTPLRPAAVRRDARVGPMTSFEISPDGDRLAFAACMNLTLVGTEKPENYRYVIATAELDSLSIHLLSTGHGFANYPSWSPDGTQVAYLAAGGGYFDDVRKSRLHMMGPDGRSRLVPTGDHRVLLHRPRWSPDGRQLAVVGTDSGAWRLAIYTLSVDGTDLRRLGRAASGPAWSPDGERLAFATDDGETASGRVLVTMADDGTDERRISPPDGWEPQYWGDHEILRDFGWISTLAWSPAGDRLLYTCGNRICVVALDGSPVGRSPAEWELASVAAWSPDGTRIAVAGGATLETPRGGQWLYTMAPDGTDVEWLVGAGLRPFAIEARDRDVADSQAACRDGYVVPNPKENSGLVQDCQQLLGLRDALFGEDLSNWNPGTPIGQWVGVKVEGEPARVTGLELPAFEPWWWERIPRPIPSALRSLSQLRVLDLSGNSFSGPIPPELGDLAALSHLDLSVNQLTGPIPAELSRLSNLTALYLHSNSLTGPIPAELGHMANLYRLDLGSNDLRGPIPRELAKLGNLEELILAGNQLSGAIPAELGRLASLRSLQLSDNQLTGTIPRELGQLAKLWILSLSKNQLTGTIPAELGLLAELWGVFLNGNQLTGQIPGALGSLEGLDSLYLGGNQLSGQIPPALGEMANLRDLSVYGNQFTGCLPREAPVWNRRELGLPDCEAGA